MTNLHDFLQKNAQTEKKIMLVLSDLGIYNLYTDKQELFEAKIDVQGASLEDSKCRVLVESDKWNLIFNGEINEDGTVKIPIKKLKQLFKEGDVGNIKLEVIADDVYFIPWESDFKICTSRKVTVEVKNNSYSKETKPNNVIVETEVKSQKLEKSKESTTPPSVKNLNKKSLVNENKIENINHIKNLSKIFLSQNININNLYENKNKVFKIINEFVSRKNINSHNKTFIVEGVVKILSSYK